MTSSGSFAAPIRATPPVVSVPSLAVGWVSGHHIFLVIWLVICPRTSSHRLFGNGSPSPLGKPPPDPVDRRHRHGRRRSRLAGGKLIWPDGRSPARRTERGDRGPIARVYVRRACAAFPAGGSSGGLVTCWKAPDTGHPPGAAEAATC